VLLLLLLLLYCGINNDNNNNTFRLYGKDKYTKFEGTQCKDNKQYLPVTSGRTFLSTFINHIIKEGHTFRKLCAIQLCVLIIWFHDLGPYVPLCDWLTTTGDNGVAVTTAGDLWWLCSHCWRHAASYTVGPGFIHRVRAAGTWRYPLTFI
jgi:hypothetical protein